MSDWVSIIVGVILAGAGLIYLAARTISRRLPERSRRDRPERVDKAASVLDAMVSLLEQQRTLSNQITDTLEKKAQELKELIDQAEQAIAGLAARASTFNPPQAESEPEETDEAAAPEVGTGRAERAALFGTVTAVPPVRTPLPGSRLSSEEKQRLIYEYADAGMDIHEIAREMKIGKGEVKLVLSLRQGA
jgi:hypothetical protein